MHTFDLNKIGKVALIILKKYFKILLPLLMSLCCSSYKYP